MDESDLMSLFGFTVDDYLSNEAGFLTQNQNELLSKTMKARGCATRMGVVSVVVVTVTLLITFFIGADKESSGFEQSVPYYVTTVGILPLLFAIFWFIDRRRSEDLRSGHISMAEGPVQAWTKKVRQSYKVLPVYMAKIGDTNFLLNSRRHQEALASCSSLRIYYIKMPSYNIILSLKRLG